ncbi:hypothetical protein CR969_02725 [Candidatus Saccharibacteria bacterium]|nr:MAG: hypothetical protein CR969_02725 [Candidatus Saccharibacteria bacterium]
MSTLFIALSLGLAGIDPLGMLLLAAARASGMRRRPIALFGITVLVGTIAFGVGVTLLLGGQIHAIAQWFNNAPDELYVILQLLITGMLIIWGTRRIIRQLRAEPVAKSESNLVKFLRFGAIPVGLLFTLSMAIDPSFLALIPLSAHSSNLVLTILVFTIWITVSQSPLFLFVIASCLNADKKLILWIQKVQKRHAKRINTIINVCILIAAGILSTDVFWFLATGKWLL